MNQSRADDLLQKVAKVLEDIGRQATPFREHGFEYEKLEIEYSCRGSQALTCLNGVALIAFPTALAFFKADSQRGATLTTAAAFIAGLIAVVIAQSCAFFAMTERSEALAHLRDEQIFAILELSVPLGSVPHNKSTSKSTVARNGAIEKLSSSNRWRIAGLYFFGFSLTIFVIGCADAVFTILSIHEILTSR